jgi:predicted secreted Zn-dependent protease
VATTINLSDQANKILEAAQNGGVEQNFLFITTFKRYQVQLKMLSELEKEVTALGPTVTKEYVKGRENIYLNPALTSYNKTADSANRTASTLMKIITSLKGVTMNVEFEDDDL